MGKSIKITESQLKRLMSTTLNEQNEKKSSTKKSLKMMDVIENPVSKKS